MTTATEKPRDVYFIREVGTAGPIKIGCSANAEKRCQQMAPLLRKDLEIAASFLGCMEDEFRIQSMFWHDHLGGEWFEHSRMLQLVIDAAARRELDVSALPARRVRPMPNMRHPWTEAQKANASKVHLERHAINKRGWAAPMPDTPARNAWPQLRANPSPME